MELSTGEQEGLYEDTTAFRAFWGVLPQEGGKRGTTPIGHTGASKEDARSTRGWQEPPNKTQSLYLCRSFAQEISMTT